MGLYMFFQTFIWVFQQKMLAMDNVHPDNIMTYQDHAIYDDNNFRDVPIRSASFLLLACDSKGSLETCEASK
jgi:hypothetical protein